MSGANFDTLKLSETLREGGMPDVQAKAVSQALQETLSEFASRRDLREAVDELRAGFRLGMQEFRGEVRSDQQTFRSEVKTDLQAMRSDLASGLESIRAEMRQIEPRLTIHLGGIVVVALGAYTALSKWIG